VVRCECSFILAQYATCTDERSANTTCVCTDKTFFNKTGACVLANCSAADAQTAQGTFASLCATSSTSYSSTQWTSQINCTFSPQADLAVLLTRALPVRLCILKQSRFVDFHNVAHASGSGNDTAAASGTAGGSTPSASSAASALLKSEFTGAASLMAAVGMMIGAGAFALWGPFIATVLYLVMRKKLAPRDFAVCSILFAHHWAPLGPDTLALFLTRSLGFFAYFSNIMLT